MTPAWSVPDAGETRPDVMRLSGDHELRYATRIARAQPTAEAA